MPDFNTNLTNRVPATLGVTQKDIYSENDLPAPVSSIITGENTTIYLIKESFTITAGVQFKFGTSTQIRGPSGLLVTITGDTDGKPLFFGDANNAIIMDEVSLVQDGTGDLIDSNVGQFSFTILRRCLLSGGTVRLQTAAAADIENCVFQAGSSLIVNAGDTITDLRIVATSFIDTGGVIDGLFLVEAGATINNLAYDDMFVGLFNASTAVKFEAGITAGSTVFDGNRFSLTVPGAVGIQVANPDEITGSILSSVFLGTGTPLDCAPVVSSSPPVTIPDGFIFGVGISGTGDGQSSPGPGGNMLVSKSGGASNLIYLKEGLTDTNHVPAIISPNSNVRGVTWHKSDLYSCDSTGAGFVYQHDGFSTSLITTLTGTPLSGIADITFVGDDLVVCIQGDGMVYVFDGFSLTQTDSFASGFSAASGITFDGINLIIMDNDSATVNVMEGVSGVVQYSFESEATDGRGIAHIPGNGFLVADLSSTAIDIYDDPVTFDHSSPTWVVANVPGIIQSSDRGGSVFTVLGGLSFTPTMATFVDLAGTDIAYSSYQECEKNFLSDETNGEMTWLNPRNQGRALTTSITFERAGGGSDFTYQLAVVVNDIVQRDSIATGVLAGNGDVVTLSTLAISRDLVAGDTIKMQLNSVTNSTVITLFEAKLSIT